MWYNDETNLPNQQKSEVLDTATLRLGAQCCQQQKEKIGSVWGGERKNSESARQCLFYFEGRTGYAGGSYFCGKKGACLFH